MYNQIFMSVLILGFFEYVEGAPSKFYKIERIGACLDHAKDLPLDFSKITVINQKNQPLIVTGILEANENIEGDIDLQLDAQRCDSNGARCISFSNNTITNICGFIPRNPVFGDMISRMTKPLLRCNPLKKGKYVAQNLTLDMSPFEMLPIQGFRWKVKFYFYKSNKSPEVLIGCWYAEASILAATTRRH